MKVSFHHYNVNILLLALLSMQCIVVGLNDSKFWYDGMAKRSIVDKPSFVSSLFFYCEGKGKSENVRRSSEE